MAEKALVKKKKPRKKPKKERSYKKKALIWIFVFMIVDEVTPGVPLAEVIILALLIFLPRWMLTIVHRVYEYVPHRQSWHSVGDICHREVVTVTPDTPVIEVARMMRDEHTHSLIIVERKKYLPSPEETAAGQEKKKSAKKKKTKEDKAVPNIIQVPLGIITDRDIALRVEAEDLPWESTPVAKVMTSNVAVAEAGEQVHAAVEKMRGLGARQLPVVDERGALIGTISLDDTIGMLSDSLNDMVELLQREIQKEARVSS
ncbi:MAG: hypothetical protein AXA67_10305 [Methylothermaceae bacteria B42]|nr:MAG: hypothetical protein AXA67_10305 [Methylothermaceae bacteria B42]HHJ40539.1 CBS domain-containing protein [Methylothermaceae bacterium]